MSIDQTQLIQEIMDILDETFEHHHGIFLDKGTSLFETLEQIDYHQASIPVGGKCASLAAQVAHVTFYLEVLERYFVAGDTSKADWGAIWRMVEKVTPEEWEEYKANLKRTYRRIVAELRDVGTWQSDPHLASALAITVHTAYHLGEIRQALCTIK
jgi:L-rhamnose mutarotase